jgi:Transposase
VTGFVDIEQARLLDIVPGRSSKAVEDWLAQRDDQWLAGIGVVAHDPFRSYAKGPLRAHLGHARVVVDHFRISARCCVSDPVQCGSSAIGPGEEDRVRNAIVGPGPPDSLRDAQA